MSNSLPINNTAPTGAAKPGLALTLQDALERLEGSRVRLRSALTPPPASAANSDPDTRSFHPIRRARAWLRGTPWGGVVDPLVGALSDEFALWWGRQSWQASALMAKEAVSAEIGPLVRRYPIAGVVVTAGAAALLVGSGVWRWRVLRRSVSKLGTQLRHVCVSQLSNPALQSVLVGALLSYLASRTMPAAAKAEQAGPATLAEPP